MTGIGAVSGIGQMVSNFVDLYNNGASMRTILGIVKNIFRISAGWFMVGYAVYEFGGCLSWW